MIIRVERVLCVTIGIGVSDLGVLFSDFPEVLFQDVTVDPLNLSTPDLSLPRTTMYRDDPGDSMQPLDYSLGSRLHDVSPMPSFDDIPGKALLWRMYMYSLCQEGHVFVGVCSSVDRTLSWTDSAVDTHDYFT